METVVLPTPPFWLETARLITRRKELCPNGSFGLPQRKSFLQLAPAECEISFGLSRFSFVMKFQFLISLRLPAVACCALLLGLNGCRDNTFKDEDSQKQSPGFLPTELRSNGLGSLPGAIYKDQAQSPIHWQVWSKETMARAKEADRLVFAVIALPQFPQFQTVLAALSENAGTVGRINDSYVPVIIDGDASREVGILTADLCAEIDQNLQLPLFVWMTADGNPVAWIPAGYSDKNSVIELFNESDAMVKQMWSDDSEYVIENSAKDNLARQERIAMRRNVNVKSAQPAEDAVRAIRQLVSLYDPVSRNFVEAGGLFPAGTLDLLATAAVHPGLPQDLQEKCLETTQELLKDILGSAMFDPLEGGLFSSRRGPSWSLPVFNRDCVGQARAAVALFNAYSATGNSWALEKALDVIRYSEKHFTTEDGLFAVGLNSDLESIPWLWTVKEIEQNLSAEDAAWWIALTGMKAKGNLPSELDVDRQLFRTNSIAFSKPLTELAAEFAESPAAFTTRLEAVRTKLIEVREKKTGKVKRDSSAHGPATFRMVSAFAAAFAATGDLEWREKAVKLLQKARVAFSQGARLRTFNVESPAPIGEGRAFHYALALQAALDVAVITSDDGWLVWAEDLATTAAELFTASEFLQECPESAKIFDLPITDLIMLFDDSTAGLISMAECRLAEQQRPLVATFSKLATPLPTYSLERPVLHTDLLQATVARHFKVVIVAGRELTPELQLATQRLPIRMVQRRPAKDADEVPAGQVKVFLANGESRLVNTPEELAQAVLPSH